MNSFFLFSFFFFDGKDDFGIRFRSTADLAVEWAYFGGWSDLESWPKHAHVETRKTFTGLKIVTVSNSFLVDERMKGERTTWNISNSGTLAFNSQGSGLLRNKLLNPNGDGSASVLSPSLSLGGLALATRFASLLAQNNCVIWFVVNGLTTKNSFLKDL